MKRILSVGALAAVLVVAAVLVWFNFIRDDAPDAFELTEGTTSEETTTKETPSEETTTEETPTKETTTEETATEETDAVSETLDGTWLIAEGSVAGYRVVEDLGNIQDFEAVGRTTMITGSVTITGTVVDEAFFEIDVSSITSDDGRRDNAFRETMDVEQSPTARFVTTEPIDLGSIPVAGEPTTATATGDLTMRGVTNSVTFPVEAQILGSEIEVVGSIELPFADYGIANPSNRFVSVRDEGKVEVKLLLSKS